MVSITFRHGLASALFASVLALVAANGCSSDTSATPDSNAFQPGSGGSAGTGGSGGSAGKPSDAGADAKPSDGGSSLCDLTKCPTPPMGAKACCVKANTCGYLGGSICYPWSDGGAGGAGGNKP